MNLYQNAFQEFKSQYYAYIPLSIILQSCIASVAVMYILINNTFSFLDYLQLSLCVCFSMAYNATIMAQLKTKFVFNTLVATLLVSCILTVLNLYRN